MPTYDNATPQGNDQIATTQPLILGNFEFIPLAIGQEHNFDPTDPAKTYHKQASMPNEADPVALPAGTDGIYYVNGGAPKFKNASGSFFLSTSSVAFSGFSGTLTINPTTTVNIPGLTGDLGGYINVNRGGNSDGTFDIAAFFQNFWRHPARNVFGWSVPMRNTPFFDHASFPLSIGDCSPPGCLPYGRQARKSPLFLLRWNGSGCKGSGIWKL